jgi:hypothetical protein
MSKQRPVIFLDDVADSPPKRELLEWKSIRRQHPVITLDNLSPGRVLEDIENTRRGILKPNIIPSPPKPPPTKPTSIPRPIHSPDQSTPKRKIIPANRSRESTPTNLQSSGESTPTRLPSPANESFVIEEDFMDGNTITPRKPTAVNRNIETELDALMKRLTETKTMVMNTDKQIFVK